MRIDTILCDLDGVVWLAHEPIAGSVDAVARLRDAGRRVIFVTNNSAALLAEHEAALAAIGIDAAGDVISSATAAAHLVAPLERVLVTGGPGVIEAFEERGAVTVRNDGAARLRSEAFDVVAVGMDRHFDYQRLAAATSAVHGGARLIGTNADSTYPTPDGLLPGGGSILAAVATASGGDPVVAGKPHAPMAEAIAAHLDPLDGSATLMVGDRPETDGLMAQRLGCRFALVRSGVNGDAVDVAAIADASIDLDVPDLAAVVDALLDGPLVG